ncbi:MAG TPA: AbrB/MazE/SpoVT family DNA-binding domain-containing protein, partial [Vicinamibacterales bacterium]
RITSKGQVTIPQHVREKLGLLPHTEVEFDVVGDTARIRKARRKKGMTRGEMIVAHLRGTGTRRFGSTDELMKLLRGDD